MPLVDELEAYDAHIKAQGGAGLTGLLVQLGGQLSGYTAPPPPEPPPETQRRAQDTGQRRG